MSKPEKIIFLDIDGPMIPNTSFLFDRHASWRQVLDDRCIKVLHKILEKSEAKIVFNTTHNLMLEERGEIGDTTYTPGLLQRFYDAGFKDYIHKHHSTQYPSISRYDAIIDWRERHSKEQDLWVAFDDVKIDHKRAYLTNPDLGIGFGEYNHAAKYLMFKGFSVL